MPRRPKTSPLPPNWPIDSPVTCITSPSYSKHLTPAQLETIRSPPPKDSPIESLSHTPPASIQVIDETAHPAHGQRGLFASKDLPPGTFILFYIGLVHNEIDNDPNSDYDLSMDRDMGLAIDATSMGNEARFVNDYRGVPGRENRGPNSEFRDCWVKLSGKQYERRVGVYVLPAGNAGKRKDGMRKGEEVLVSYGKGFWCKGAGKEEKG
jgi:hypothetical protein